MINMLFSTLEEYNKELNDMENEIEETENYLKKHPEKHGTRGNFETMKYLYDLFSKDKIDFIVNVNNFNLKLSKETKAIPLNSLNNLNSKLNETTIFSTNLLENKINYQEKLLVKEISQGSYKITYAFPNPTEDDVKRISPRKKGLLKIFDFINCKDDIEKLKKEAGPNGREALLSYKEFLAEIVKLETGFTLDTEMGTVEAGLTLQQCKNICQNLNI